MSKSIFSLFSFLLVFFSVFAQNQKETVVQISTSYGIIKVKLFNETPMHRDNFIKSVKEGKYEGTDFFRIINNYMIQGGKMTDETGMKTLPAEFVAGKFNKRGALAAVISDDTLNTEKRTSSSQFCIVLGSTYAYELMDRMGDRMKYKFSEEQKQAYSKIGGVPNMDGQNTVFGEVVEGMDVVEKIASSPVKGETPTEKIIVSMQITD